MKTAFRKSFLRDLKKIKDVELRRRLQQVIEAVEQAAHLQALTDVKKIAGTTNCYRIRVGDYRLGAVLDGDAVVFVRCLNRRDLYRYFP